MPPHTERRARGGPCKNPNCTERDNASGQWAFLPLAFAQENGFDPDNCHCHKRPCRRWCGKLEETLPPGRPPARVPMKRVRAGDAIGVALDAADDLPRPPILVSIDEIWGVRCAVASLTLIPSCVARLRAPLAMCVCRYIHFELLESWERGNKLGHQPSLEYAVHGKYQRTEDDLNGVHGCWWLGLRELVRILGEAEVTRAVELFERELVSERKEAMAREMSELETECAEEE